MAYFIDCGEFFFRAVDRRDLDGGWPEWFNDPQVTTYQNKGYFPTTRDGQAAYLESIRGGNTDVVFALEEKSSGIHFGNIGLHQIDWLHRTAVVGIVFGVREFQGRGWGKIAWNSITQYAFQTLGLEKLVAVILDGNEASRRCAEYSGFVEEGRQRAQFYKNGRRLDALLMGITRERWISRRGTGNSAE